MGRPSCPARTRNGERRRESARESLQRELAVAGLATGILGDRDHPRAEAGDDAALLLVVEGVRGGDVEYGLDSRRGDVRMLAARPRGSGSADHHLAERNRCVAPDRHRIFHAWEG